MEITQLKGTFLAARIKEMRWRILRVLNAGRPLLASENLMHLVLNDTNFHVSLVEIRRNLDYLEKKNLVLVHKEPIWVVELTAYGIDVVEYSVPNPDGIARPAEIIVDA